MREFRFTSLNDAKFVRGVESFEVLSKSRFTVFEVSPLFGIKCNQMDFKREEKELKHWLSKYFPGLMVDITRVNGLPYSPSSLMIEISFESKSHKKYYKGLMVSVLDSNPSEEHLYLPFLCEIHSTHLGAKIRELIGNIFQCNIRQLTLSDEEFVTVWGTAFHELIRRNNFSDLSLVYEIPELPSSVRLECFIPKENAVNLWCGLQDPGSTFLDLDKVKQFWLGIEEHVYFSFGIFLSRTKITKFKMGEIDFVSKEKAWYVLVSTVFTPNSMVAKITHKVD